MDSRIRPGVLVQIVEHTNGSTTAYLEYYLGVDGATLARTGQIPMPPTEYVPGSKAWVEEMLTQVIAMM